MKPQAAREQEVPKHPASKQLENILNIVVEELAPAKNPSADQIKAYAELVKSAAEPLKAGKTTRIEFSLTRMEFGILGLWIAVSFLLLILGTIFSLSSGDKVQVILYWSSVLAVLLGTKGLLSLKGSEE